MPKKYQPAGFHMTQSQTRLGKFIRDRRLQLDLRQVQLAELVGISQSRVSFLEIGKRTYLDEEKLARFAEALECSEAELLRCMSFNEGSQPTTELGKLIYSRRRELGLSRSALGKKMGMTGSKVRHFEVAAKQTIHYRVVKLFAKALELDPSVFAKFVGAGSKQSQSKLGQLIRKRRRELGMSSMDLAVKLKVSRQYVCQIELGNNRLSGKSKMLKRLAQVLNLDVNELEVLRPTRRRKQTKNATLLGDFLAKKRLELGLTQLEVRERAKISRGVVSLVETGRLYPNPKLLEKLTKVLDCQIPPELIPLPRKRKEGHKNPGYM